MNQAVPLYAVVIVVGALLVLYLVHRMVSELHQSAGRIAQAIEDNTKGIESLRLVAQTLVERLPAHEAEIKGALSRWGSSGDMSLSAATAALNKMQATMAPAAEEIRANMAAIPKLLEAVARVGSAQLQLAQNQAKGHPFGKPNGPLPPRDTASADVEYEVQELMRQGMSETEARMRLNPANDQSVWSNDNLFRGWDR